MKRDPDAVGCRHRQPLDTPAAPGEQLGPEKAASLGNAFRARAQPCPGPGEWGLGDGMRGISGLRFVLCHMGRRIHMLPAPQVVVYTRERQSE